MISCIEQSKESTKTLLELIQKFGQVAGHKIRTQKSNVFLYTYDEQSENEI